MKVLLADNDVDLVGLLEYTLRRAGYSVLTAFDGDVALQSWESERPDLVLLDGSLPKVDGFEVCRRIRDQARTPIIFLTERSAEADILGGLDTGADDYVIKPFSAKQLLARMQAILRRYSDNPEQFETHEVRAGDLVLKLETYAVLKTGRPVAVTRLEFRILSCLVLNEGAVVPYSRLVEHSWGYYGTEGSNMVLLKSHMSHLRKKLSLPKIGPGSIRSILGVGYCLTKA